MLHPDVHAARRKQLLAEVGGPILLLGNAQRARNLPMVEFPFRQDSSFLYLTGCTTPGAALLLTEAQETLFLPPAHEDDALWHGPTLPLAEQARLLGFDHVEPSPHLAVIAPKLEHPKVLAVPDESRNQRLSGWAGVPLRFGRHHGDEALVDALIRMRRPKSEPELDQMREAARISNLAHRAVMASTRPGATEQGLTALFEAVLSVHGACTGYGTILSVHGEILHNHHHGNTLQDGQLLLLDGGGEVPSGYGVDITRTTPVSGRYTPRQRDVYQAVLDAELASIDACRRGVRYREVHDIASRILATFLADAGLLTCDADAALETGAHGLFYPHGTGHLLGLDVHDLENFGDRPSYPVGQARPTVFGTRNLRLDLPLEPGWVVTVEPGIYFVPAILHDPALREQFAGLVDFEAAESWLDFGGIRIEDDVAVTPTTPEVLTAAIPKTLDDVEALTGSGPTLEQRFC